LDFVAAGGCAAPISVERQNRLERRALTVAVDHSVRTRSWERDGHACAQGL